MKADEMKTPCPVCHLGYGPQGMLRHITVMAYYERRTKDLKVKKHQDYYAELINKAKCIK